MRYAIPRVVGRHRLDVAGKLRGAFNRGFTGPENFVSIRKNGGHKTDVEPAETLRFVVIWQVPVDNKQENNDNTPTQCGLLLIVNVVSLYLN